ncbi:MAG: YggS family pyridoxal phosphate-dependent enzyme [Anaerolineaceae bacterium]
MTGRIKDNLKEVLEKINIAATNSGRSTNSVQLVVVTKKQSVQNIFEVIAAGANVLGENYPEETHSKANELIDLNQNYVWHMIGHLQSRKIKYILEHFSMIHSIDGGEIARELGSELAEVGTTLPALFEVNISGEESKHGFASWEEKNWPELVDQFLQIQAASPALTFKGLMTMPPFSENGEDSRPYFVRCRKLLEFYQKRSGDNSFCQLSMGTSLDYEVAITEGATCVRIGEAIMGKRIY